MSDQHRNCPNLARALACLFKDMLFDESPDQYPKRQRNSNSKNLTLIPNIEPIKYLTFICKKAIHVLKKQERTMENISSILLGEQYEFRKTLTRLGINHSETDFSFLANAQHLTRQFFYSMFSKNPQTRQKYWKTYQNQKEKTDKQQLVNLKNFVNQYLFDQIKLSWNTKTERFSYKRFFKSRQTKIQKCQESQSSTGFEFNQQTNSNLMMKLIQWQQNEYKIQDEFSHLFYTENSQYIQVQQDLNCSRGYEQQQSFSSIPENNIQLNISVCSGKEWLLEPQFCPQAWNNFE